MATIFWIILMKMKTKIYDI